MMRKPAPDAYDRTSLLGQDSIPGNLSIPRIGRQLYGYECTLGSATRRKHLEVNKRLCPAEMKAMI